jgi:glycosyltransferase involved in cell wall biosynthesis
MSRVDVIVPCYKYAHFLRGAVESVLGQEGVEVRVLILDDASPDRTAEVAAELAEVDPRVEWRRHGVNRGHIATYNEGLDWADGDYAVLLSADDVLTPGSLARAARLMDAHPSVGMAHGPGIIFEAEPPLWRGPSGGECTGSVIAGAAFLESFCAEGNNLVCTPTAVVRTRLQKELGGYRADLPHAGDMEMWMRFAAYGDVGVLDAVQAYYRVHAASMSRAYYETALLDLRQRKAAFDAVFEGHGASIREGDRLRQMADRELSMIAFWAASDAFETGDMARFRGLLDFALQVDPGVLARPEYARLLWKLRIGPRTLSALRPLIELAKGRRRRPAGSL